MKLPLWRVDAFASKIFAGNPAAVVPEDPVTGSAHCRLVPYWARELGKTTLHARQVSARGGELWCELKGDRVHLAGHVAPYLEGTIEVQAGLSEAKPSWDSLRSSQPTDLNQPRCLPSTSASAGTRPSTSCSAVPRKRA